MKRIIIIALILFVVTSAMAGPTGDALIQQGFKLVEGQYIRHDARMNITETIYFKNPVILYKLELNTFQAFTVIAEKIVDEKLFNDNIARNLIILRLKALRILLKEKNEKDVPIIKEYQGAKDA